MQLANNAQIKTEITEERFVSALLAHLWTHRVSRVGLAQLALLRRTATGVGLDWTVAASCERNRQKGEKKMRESPP